MRLWPDLGAKFLRHIPAGTVHEGTLFENGGHYPVDTLQEADGVMFLCPKCFMEEPVGRPGTHMVICWFVGRVSDDVHPGPGRWTPQGSGLHDLTFIPGSGRSHSVALLGGGCMWHGFVTNGDAS